MTYGQTLGFKLVGVPEGAVGRVEGLARERKNMASDYNNTELVSRDDPWAEMMKTKSRTHTCLVSGSADGGSLTRVSHTSQSRMIAEP